MFDAQPPKSRVLAGRYELQGTLGRGGMGVVYRALDLQTQRPVAIKRPARAASQNHLLRFRREGEALARLKHPGVVPVLDLGHERGEPFIVLDLVGGHSLEEVIRGRGELPEDEVLLLGRCLAEALAYAHEREVLHRDVKPDNVLLPQPDQPVLVDFGLAKFEETQSGRLTATGALAGTPGYAAPEQLADAGRVDARADIYGLGATLYACLTGGPPGGQGPAVNLVAVAAAGAFPSPRALRSSVSRELDALVMRALARDASERLPSMAEFADALAALERAQRARGVPGGRRRGLWVAGVLTASLLGGVGVAALLSQGPSGTDRPSLGATGLATSSPAGSPGELSPTPLATPSAPPLSEAEAERAGGRLQRALLELQAADSAIVEQRFEALEEALTQAERIGAPTPEQHLVLGRAYRELARWDDALAAYRGAERPGFELRAQLGQGLVNLSRLDLQEGERRAAQRQARETLAGAARSVVEQEPGLERGAGLLAELALRLWELPQGIEISGTGNRVRMIQGQVPAEELLLRQEIHFAISLGLRKTRALSVAGTRLEVLEPAPAPMWSPGYAFPLARRFQLTALTRSSLRPTELLLRITRGRGGSARLLAQVQAEAGLVGGLERTLAAPEAGLGLPEVEALRGTLRRACAKAGRVLGHARTPGNYRFRLEPEEKDLLLWVHVPEGTEALEIQLQGPEADLDLYAAQDGVPPSGTPWRSDDLTHSEFLAISRQSKPALEPGVVQVRISRYRTWPEPVLGFASVHLRRPGDPPRIRWKNAWELNLNSAPRGLRPAFVKAHELFLAGQSRELEDLLRPYQRRVPALAALRVKLLLGLMDMKGIRALASELEGLGQPLPLPVRYALVPVLAGEQGPAAAVAAADAILAEHPDLLELALMAARYELQARKPTAAYRRVMALSERDSADLKIKCLLLTLRIARREEAACDLAELLIREDPPDLLVTDRIELLSSLGRERPEVADRLLGEIQARTPKPTPTQLLRWIRYLFIRRRVEEARRLLAEVETRPLCPANRHDLESFREALR